MEKKWLGPQVQLPVSDTVPYGAQVANWDVCKNVINTNSSVNQVVYDKTFKRCFPMSEMSSKDQDGRGGSNTGFISAQRNTSWKEIKSNYTIEVTDINSVKTFTILKSELSSKWPDIFQGTDIKNLYLIIQIYDASNNTRYSSNMGIIQIDYNKPDNPSINIITKTYQDSNNKTYILSNELQYQVSYDTDSAKGTLSSDSAIELKNNQTPFHNTEDLRYLLNYHFTTHQLVSSSTQGTKITNIYDDKKFRQCKRL